MQAPGRYRPPTSHSGLTPVSLCFSDPHRGTPSYLRFSCSALQHAACLLWPRLTSGNPSRHLSMPIALRADRQISPGMTHSPSRLCPSDLRRGVPYKYRALHLFACLPHRVASYPLRVPRTSALPAASFRSHLAMDTLAVRLTLPLVGCVEDLHLQVSAPCRAHKEKGPVRVNRPLVFARFFFCALSPASSRARSSARRGGSRRGPAPCRSKRPDVLRLRRS